MKSVLITGASTGIGEACARLLDAKGWKVFAGVRKPEDGERLRADATTNMQPVIVDVTDAASIARARDEIAAAAGNGLDGLVNNAGVGFGGPLEFVPLDELRRQLEVNVVGQVAVTQAFLPLLRARRGRVVMMSSIAGLFAVPFAGPYAASKHALEALSDALRIELAPWKIGVSIVEPGSIATPIWEKAVATADSVEAGLSDEARALYGDTMPIVRKAMTERTGIGIPASHVAQAVLHALASPRPKTRYLVGKDAKIRAQVARLLPDRVRDALIFKQSGLPR